MIPATTPHPRTVFTLPADLLADSPPEARGVARDDVRLLVAAPTGIRHARFPELGRFLEAGDVVCVNTSATRPAAVDGTLAGRGVVAHLAGSLDDGSWLVEIREPQGTGPARDAAAGASVQIAGGAVLTLLAGYPDRHRRIGSRLWVARVDAETPVLEHLDRYGRPISYGYVRGRWPLAAYQTVFARDPGSAEMPSAGRPFSDRLVTDLVARGVVVAPVLLHTGLSSPDAREAPIPEWFRVPAQTAELVAGAVRGGRRIVAVGTSVVRALETATGDDGSISARSGWTTLVLDPGSPARTVTGLVTGWHPPQASHLALLEAVAGPRLVQVAYDSAVAAGYLWHEFGDACLFLPELA